MAERRKDSKKRVLKEGEYQRSNGTYEYRWRSENGKRNNVYSTNRIDVALPKRTCFVH